MALDLWENDGDMFLVRREDLAFYHKLLHRGALYPKKKGCRVVSIDGHSIGFLNYKKNAKQHKNRCVGYENLPKSVQAMISPERFLLQDEEGIDFCESWTAEDKWKSPLAQAVELINEANEPRIITVGASKLEKKHAFYHKNVQTVMIFNMCWSPLAVDFDNKEMFPCLELNASPDILEQTTTDINLWEEGGMIDLLKNGQMIMCDASMSLVPYKTVRLKEQYIPRGTRTNTDQCKIRNKFFKSKEDNNISSYKAQFKLESDDILLFCKRLYVSETPSCFNFFTMLWLFLLMFLTNFDSFYKNLCKIISCCKLS